MSKQQRKTLMISILSLSLLSVMAGAAVAPALGVIKEAFPNASQLAIQLIISMPALFIFLTNMIFPRLSAKFGSKTLVLAGLTLYTVGGVAAGLFSNITLLLCMRALVGVGVGIIMPLVSAALYLSQFVSPFLMTGASAVLGNFRHPAYLFGMVLSILFLLWSLTIKVIVPKPLELAAELEEQKTASHS